VQVKSISSSDALTSVESQLKQSKLRHLFNVGPGKLKWCHAGYKKHWIDISVTTLSTCCHNWPQN